MLWHVRQPTDKHMRLDKAESCTPAPGNRGKWSVQRTPALEDQEQVQRQEEEKVLFVQPLPCPAPMSLEETPPPEGD